MAKKTMSREDYHYGIRCHTDDLAVLHALRGLSQCAETSALKFYAWSGTGKKEWQDQGRQVTFHFSSPSFREEFIKHAVRLLPQGSWQKLDEPDNEPAPENARPRSRR